MLVGDSGSLVRALLLALLLDALVGDPPLLWRRLPHPVVIIGGAISRLEGWLWRPQGGELRGALLVVLLLVPVGLISGLFDWGLRRLPYGWILLGCLFWPWFAWRCLVDHVLAVAAASSAGIERARSAVAHLVGRDTGSLDLPAVGRAAVESLAENFADGVVAPWFWTLVLGFPGLALYKAINTLDSMIGYRNARYRSFGRAAARLDDLVNWIPARLAAGLLVIAAGRAAPAAWQTVRRDARRHRSPNAGWPEAAVAGALGLRLSGPRSYHGRVELEPWIGTGRERLGPEDIRAAVRLCRRAFALLVLLTLPLLAVG